MKAKYKTISLSLLFLFSTISLHALHRNMPVKDASSQTTISVKTTNHKAQKIHKHLLKRLKKCFVNAAPEKGLQISGGLIGLGLILIVMSLLGLFVSIFVAGIAVFMLIGLGLGVLLGILGFLV